MIQEVLVGRGDTISTFFVGTRPTSCTVTILDSEANALVTAASCTVDVVNTTLAAPALAGALTLTLTSGAGVTTRRRYLVGDEEVTLKSVSGVTANLWAPLNRDQPNGSPFQGLRVSYAVSPVIATSELFDLQAVFTPSTGDEQTEIVNFVIRKIPENLISEVDLRKLVPKSVMALSGETDMHQALRDARDELIIDLGGRERTSRILGVDHLRRLASIRFWLDRRWEFGDAWAGQMDAWQKEYEQSLAQTLAEVPEGNAAGGADAPAGAGVSFNGMNPGWL